MSRNYPGWEHFSPHAAKAAPKKRKYHNEPTQIDGHTFPSKREANRYVLLRDMMKAGEISALELQPKFPLHVVRPDGVKVEIGIFRADFSYYDANGARVIEDAKGVRTESYQMRKRHVEAEYGIRILET
jgi:hypothetical protein